MQYAPATLGILISGGLIGYGLHLTKEPRCLFGLLIWVPLCYYTFGGLTIH